MKRIHMWVVKKVNYDYETAELIDTAIGGVCAVLIIIAPTLIIGA